MMTLPPRGEPADVLWSRFCEATQLDVDGLDLRGAGNESLGAASAELMRRVSQHAQERGLTREQFEPLRTLLGKQILAARRGQEPELVVPTVHRGVVDERTNDLVAGVRAVTPRIVGSLDDLQSQWGDDDPSRTTSAPKSLDQDVLMAAAIDGLIGLSEQTRFE